MRRILSLAALALGALVAIDGCTLLLGENKDFRERDGGGGGGGGGATGTASSGGGVTVGSASSSSGGPPMCRLLHDTEDCGAGRRCTVANESSGDTYCRTITGTPLLPYDACTNDTTCPQGTWCDHPTSVCKPICAKASDCPSMSCVAATTSGGNTIPGLDVCLAHCDPINAAPCGKGTTCVYEKSKGDLDCARSLGVQPGATCQFSDDCVAGYVCGGTCVQWCHPAVMSASCGTGDCVEFVNVSVMFNGDSYGYVCP